MTDTGERNVADELTAIKIVADSLQPLSEASRRHVIAYVADALGIATSPVSATREMTPLERPPTDLKLAAEPSLALELPTDIRSLKEQKEPRSANEMAALVAYYISELLPADERRAVITGADIEKYFKRANFRLPSRLAQTLPDAARAGYFDTVDRGQYRLNPVGYNLVAHGMPSRGGEAPARTSRPRKATARRTAKKAGPKKAAARTKATTRTANKPAVAARAKRPTPKRS